jgi:hypothetical protein
MPGPIPVSPWSVRIYVKEPPPIRWVVRVPGFQAASMVPVSRLVFSATSRMSASPLHAALPDQ